MKVPMICTACGELVIAWLPADHEPILPAHPDRIEPGKTCALSLVTFGNLPAGPAGSV